MRFLIVVLLACVSACGAESEREPAGLALLNATIWTGDPDNPIAEAILIEGDRIVAIGSSSSIRPQIGQARVIDATGRFVVPGFIDSHVHFLDGGFKLSSVQLRDADTPEEFARRIGEFAKTVPAGAWITGGDWDHQLWGGELPHRAMVDELTPAHPVWVNRLDGHMALANSLALELAGVTRDTADVAGGTIERDGNGDPTGVLKDNAMDLVFDVLPPPDDAAYDRALEAATSHLAARGVTSVHHMGSWDTLAVVQRARDHGTLKTRVYAAVPLADWERLRDEVAKHGRGDAWLRYGVLKGFVDGSLGSHTAAFHAPFDDKPSDRGFFINTEEDLQTWISGADAAGLHVVVHAIGDRANEKLLDIFERVARENGARDRRFRIEHAQHLRPEDIPRFAELGVIASMQPYHAIDDGRWAERYIGPIRIQTTYAFQSLLDAGATLAFGSDWTVAPATPVEGIYAAVTRRTLDDANPEGWVPNEKISVEEALVAYTRNGAYASHEEHEKGMLKLGYLADLVVLDSDLTRISPEEIGNAEVVMTIVGGEIVYQP
ncbi:MAG: amidohydrolase [Acidobacteria bacterium]|nr:MAG: amidohydrolase [Acidobacteriota bacterium]